MRALPGQIRVTSPTVALTNAVLRLAILLTKTVRQTTITRVSLLTQLEGLPLVPVVTTVPHVRQVPTTAVLKRLDVALQGGRTVEAAVDAEARSSFPTPTVRRKGGSVGTRPAAHEEVATIAIWSVEGATRASPHGVNPTKRRLLTPLAVAGMDAGSPTTATRPTHPWTVRPVAFATKDETPVVVRRVPTQGPPRARLATALQHVPLGP